MSKKSFKVSGKRVEITDSGAPSSLMRRPGGWLIAEHTRPDGSIERKRFMVSQKGTHLSFSVGGRLWSGELQVSDRSSSGSDQNDDSDLVAQFPGKVRKILVQAGAKVEQGEGLVLIEAMKMEFAVKAPFAGKIRKILVQEGQQLSPGDRFVELEALAHGK